MIDLLNWVLSHFGLAGLISLGSLAAVGYMLRLSARTLTDVSTGNNAGLQQISQILEAQRESHTLMMTNQTQHTEILRSLTHEVKSLSDNMYRSELERTRQLVDLVGKLAERKSDV